LPSFQVAKSTVQLLSLMLGGTHRCNGVCLGRHAIGSIEVRLEAGFGRGL
jgi:hypothetical protein